MPVNHKYYYEGDDIISLYPSITDERIKWAVTIPIIEGQEANALEILSPDFEMLEEGQRLLLPLNSNLNGNGHWIGAMVEKSGNKFQITWLDSLNPTQQIPENIREAFAGSLGIELESKPNAYLPIKKQADNYSCGPWMIENLQAVSAISLASEPEKVAIRNKYNATTEYNIRESHIEILGERFAIKQLVNNSGEIIDPIKLEAFRGNEYELEEMNVLLYMIQNSQLTEEFRNSINTLTELNQVSPDETLLHLDSLNRKFPEFKDIIDAIQPNATKPGYLISLNERIKLQEHSLQNSRSNTRGNSRENSIGNGTESPIDAASSHDQLTAIYTETSRNKIDDTTINSTDSLESDDIRPRLPKLDFQNHESQDLKRINSTDSLEFDDIYNSRLSSRSGSISEESSTTQQERVAQAAAKLAIASLSKTSSHNFESMAIDIRSGINSTGSLSPSLQKRTDQTPVNDIIKPAVAKLFHTLSDDFKTNLVNAVNLLGTLDNADEKQEIWQELKDVWKTKTSAQDKKDFALLTLMEKMNFDYKQTDQINILANHPNQYLVDKRNSGRIL